MTLEECKNQFPLYKIIESIEIDNLFGSPSDICDGWTTRYWKIVGYCSPSENDEWLPVVLTKNKQIKWYYPSLSGWRIIEEDIDINILKEQIHTTMYLGV